MGTENAAIGDDDALPALSVDDVTVTEGDAGAVQATFTVGLDAPSGRVVLVDFADENGTATAPADYAAAAGTLTFVPGETTKPVTLLVAGDTLDELDETFDVDLTNAVHAAIAGGAGLGTILDDDASPTMAIGDITVVEA